MKLNHILLVTTTMLMATQVNAWCVKNATVTADKATVMVERIHTQLVKDNKMRISSLSPGESICEPALAADASPTGDKPNTLRVQVLVETGVPGCMDKKVKACIKLCTNDGKKAKALTLKDKDTVQISRKATGEFFVAYGEKVSGVTNQTQVICK
jgi:hypothetical protein